MQGPMIIQVIFIRFPFVVCITYVSKICDITAYCSAVCRHFVLEQNWTQHVVHYTIILKVFFHLNKQSLKILTIRLDGFLYPGCARSSNYSCWPWKAVPARECSWPRPRWVGSVESILSGLEEGSSYRELKEITSWTLLRTKQSRIFLNITKLQKQPFLNL